MRLIIIMAYWLVWILSDIFCFNSLSDFNWKFTLVWTIACCFDPCSALFAVGAGARAWAQEPRLGEADHPWSIKESAAAALARLAKEPAGGPAQEIITARGGVPTFIAVHRDPACTEACKVFLAEALRLLMPYTPAKEEMRGYDILRFGGDNGVEVVL